MLMMNALQLIGMMFITFFFLAATVMTILIPTAVYIHNRIAYVKASLTPYYFVYPIGSFLLGYILFNYFLSI